MNATSVDELRSAATNREVRDEKMEQVRQLLFGDHAREVSTRFMLLESRVRELEMGVARQLEAMSQRIEQLASKSGDEFRTAFDQIEAMSQRVEQLASTSGDERRTSFDELSRNIHELGERIGVMAKR